MVALVTQPGVSVEVVPVRKLLELAQIVQIACGLSIRNTMLCKLLELAQIVQIACGSSIRNTMLSVR